MDEAVQKLDFCLEVMGGVVDGLYAARDIHQTHLLQALQQVSLFSIQQNKGVFGHGSNHTCSEASSSSA